MSNTIIQAATIITAYLCFKLGQSFNCCLADRLQIEIQWEIAWPSSCSYAAGLLLKSLSVLWNISEEPVQWLFSWLSQLLAHVLLDVSILVQHQIGGVPRCNIRVSQHLIVWDTGPQLPHLPCCQRNWFLTFWDPGGYSYRAPEVTNSALFQALLITQSMILVFCWEVSSCESQEEDAALVIILLHLFSTLSSVSVPSTVSASSWYATFSTLHLILLDPCNTLIFHH
jgi:hypothetical protein